MTKYATKYALDDMRPTVHDDPDCPGLSGAGEIEELEEPLDFVNRCSICHEDSPFPLRRGTP